MIQHINKVPKLIPCKHIAITFLLVIISCGLVVANTRGNPKLQQKGWKTWSEYSDRERDSLCARWTASGMDTVIDELLDSVQTGGPLRGVNILIEPLHDTAVAEGYDLRGIVIDQDRFILSDANFKARRPLGYVHLEGATLINANLRGAYLYGAHLSNTNLTEANLVGANLQNADMTKTNLTHAYCDYANMVNAHLWNAELLEAACYSTDFDGADFTQADFKKTILSTSKLKDADFFQSVFDTTYLAFAGLGDAKIRYISWGSAGVRNYCVGEEAAIDTSRSEMTMQIALDTYDDLEGFYTKVGRPDLAKEFHYRANELITNSKMWYNPAKWFRILLLKLPYGYGARPWFLLAYALWIVLAFALLYAIITLIPSKSGIAVVHPVGNHTREEPLLEFKHGRIFLSCLYFSILSLSTFGYGAITPKPWLEFFMLEPEVYNPHRWVRVLVGIEAVIGIYIFALLVTILFGKA